MTVDEYKETIPEKTFKREVAVVALLFWAVGTVRLFWLVEPEAITLYKDIYAPWTTMSWLFAGGAFAIDQLKKM